MGAKYRKKDSFTKDFIPDANIPPNTTTFFTLAKVNANQNLVRIPSAENLIIEAIYAQAAGAAGAGETFDYTLHVNNIASALTVQIAGAVQVDNNLENTPVAVARGDTLAIEIVTSLNGAQTFHSVSIRCRRA